MLAYIIYDVSPILINDAQCKELAKEVMTEETASMLYDRSAVQQGARFASIQNSLTKMQLLKCSPYHFMGDK